MTDGLPTPAGSDVSAAVVSPLPEALYTKRKRLHKAISANKAKTPRDEKLDLELDSMVAERKAISRLIKDINGKQALNFLTDEGLIPNYAFPEEGVTLRSVIHHLHHTTQQFMEEVLHREKMAVVGNMVNSILHDYKNPVAYGRTTKRGIVSRFTRSEYSGAMDSRFHGRVLRAGRNALCALLPENHQLNPAALSQPASSGSRRRHAEN